MIALCGGPYIFKVVQKVCDGLSFGIGEYIVVVYFGAATTAVEYLSTKVSHLVLFARMGAEATQLAASNPKTFFTVRPG